MKQYQVVLDPVKMAALGITHEDVRAALAAGNQETGGGV